MSNWLTLYQVDAFTSEIFKGNPAAVIPLSQWLSDEQMQKIATENNLSETAFFSADDQGGLLLRWFTPEKEVELCGHATLASAYVLFEEMGFAGDEIVFNTLYKGKLTVSRNQDKYVMTLPNLQASVETNVPEALSKGLNVEVSQVLASDDYLVILPEESDVLAISPNFEALAKLDRRGVIVSAPGKTVDFVSRYFAPAFGIDEDPVTGSAHCISAPYWAEKLGKNELVAKQVSARGGDLVCRVEGSTVTLIGDAVLYLKGSIQIG